MTAAALLALGVLLGTGEFAICGLLSTIVASAVRYEPIGEDNWMAIVGSDAVRPYRALARRLPTMATVAAFVLIGLVQELMLRAGAIAVTGGRTELAVAVSVMVSLLVMTVPARGTEARCLAAVVGTVTGCVHALLYSKTHTVLPLAVANAAFVSLTSLQPPNQSLSGGPS
ncbi:hypothetical protein [Streptomyces sp. RPT161]|uniref:hypothetical protein n=1 Tax=Streptomyces sp. RPT161 TaxID=3015993 RepID=UPI0022B8F9BA|nr:hypothetical protein [Streptomyces sp. RPT161]